MELVKEASENQIWCSSLETGCYRNNRETIISAKLESELLRRVGNEG